MKKNTLIPAMFCALLSNTALAGDLVIDIATPLITPTPSSSNDALIMINENTGNIEALVDSTTAKVNFSKTLGVVSGGNPSNENNKFTAVAGANTQIDSTTKEYLGNNTNAIVFDSTSTAGAEALIGSINLNFGKVDALVEGVDLSINADSATSSSQVEINNNSLRSLAIINGQDNFVTGDMSSTTETLGTAALIDHDKTNGLLNANGDIVIAAFQKNNSKGVANSKIQNIDAKIDVTTGTGSLFEIQGNQFTAGTEVNFLNNVIDVEHTGLDLNFVVAAVQNNEAKANSLIDDIDLSQDIEEASESDMKISNNDLMAYTLVNVMNNQISSDSGGEGGTINLLYDQDNSGDLSSVVTNVNMSLSADSTAGSAYGDLSINNNNVSATAAANAIVNNIEFVGGNDGSSTTNKIAGFQYNSGDLTASVSDVDMRFTAQTGTVGAGVATSRNNSITATAVANSARNIIRMR